MNVSAPQQVAIIGAGLSGLSLALALNRAGITCTVYELRSKSYAIAGAVMLSPNGLRVLDSLGVYERIQSKGYNCEANSVKNDKGETTEKYYYGHAQLYGYRALRIYRQVLIDELTLMVQERGIPIRFGTKFSHVISETKDNVDFCFMDGSSESASLLIGADGIYSRVRRYIYPDLVPKYSGFLAVWSEVPTSKLRFPEDIDFVLPATVVAKPGAFLIVPQDANGSIVMAGVQRAFPEHDRAGWEKLGASNAELLAFLRKDQELWPDIVQSALEIIPHDDFSIWPFYTVPRLENWTSSDRRVIILGDAAHAIPPSAGQGVNQCLEDIHMLALLLPKLSDKITLPDALDFWQSCRQERVGKALGLAQQMNIKRLPPAEQAKLPAGTVWKDESATTGEGGQLRWLYEPHLEEQVSSWIEKQNHSVSSNRA
ncbi:hypothetical protein MMC18_005836 [Xylographa bjoerkii]|nr:hypothetical protein [Xylographa bjoerkii]